MAIHFTWFFKLYIHKVCRGKYLLVEFKLLMSAKQIQSLNALDFDKTYSYADYLTWQFDEFVELIKGKIFPMSAPQWQHQQIVGNFYGTIWSAIKGKSCQVFPAPFDVRLTQTLTLSDDKQTTVVQPDITIICRPEIIKGTGCVGAPDAVIEVVSPSTAERDMKTKLDLYAENGVNEYWIAFPKEQIVLAYDLENGQYQLRKSYTIDDTIPMITFEDLEIDLTEVFNRIEE